MEASTPRLHPLIAAAAVSVIVFSAIGVVALTGRMSGASPAALAAPQPLAPAAVATPVAPPAATPEVAPAPAPRPKAVKKAVVRASAPAPVQSAPEAQAAPATMPAPVASPTPPAAIPATVAQARADAGVVESVREVKAKGESTWMGPVAGGIGGAVLGSQVGKGTTRTIMGVLGAAGGAYAGREIEKHVRSTTHWEVDVRMDDGSSRTVSYQAQPGFRQGERVRLENGTLAHDQRT